MANKTHTAQIRELREEIAALKQQLNTQPPPAPEPDSIQTLTEHVNRLTEKVNKQDTAISVLIPHLHTALSWCFVTARHHGNEQLQTKLKVAGEGLNRLLTKLK